MKTPLLVLLGLLALPVVSPAVLFSNTINVNDPDGNYSYSGSVDFTQSGTLLNVVMTNTATTAGNFQRRVLTAVFWDMAGTPTVTKNTASITGGSTQINGGDPVGDIGKHWAYKQGLGANQWGNANYGISSVGLGFFGPTNTFISGGGSPNGTDYGLVPAAGTSLVANPYVKNSMSFTLNLPVGFTLASDGISNVWFQWGSDPSEYYATVPEPGTLAALGIGAVALLRRRRRR